MAAPSYADTALADLFVDAEQIKLADPTRYQQLLRKIAGYPLSQNQQQHLMYLEGFGAQYLGQHEVAAEKYQAALLLGDSVDVRYKTTIALSNLMTVKRNMAAAFSYMFEAMEMVPKLTQKSLQDMVQIQALTSYSTAELFTEALAMSEQLIRQNVEGRHRCIAHYYRNHSLQKLQPKQVDIVQVRQNIAFCESINEPLLTNFARTVEIQYLLNRQEYDKAVALTEQHLPSVEQSRFLHFLSRYYVLLARAYTGSEQVVKALAVLDKLFAVTEQLDSGGPMVDGYKLRSELAEQQGHLAEALYFHKQYVAAEQIYQDRLSAQQIAFHLAKGEIQAKNQQIDLLEKDNELLLLQQELASTETQRTQLIILLLAFGLLSTGYFAYKTLRSKQRYRVLAENDNLTGISNRYHFTEQVCGLLESSKKQVQIDSFLIFDLDLFKLVNDQFGHLAGDWVLQKVVEHCRPFVRNLDVFGRIGGEEFALFLPSCTAEKAALLAEILRDAIAQIDYASSGFPIQMTASFGVTSTDRSGYELRHLFRDADHALYMSKNAGRNQVSLFNPKKLRLAH